jgi:beta-phosphoglucomutase-like phosphatase (HAD superfamily)
VIYGLDKIKGQAAKRLAALLESGDYRKLFETGDFSVVQNPAGVYPPFDVYPLSVATPRRLPRLDLILMDMDGTTTTTEVLCLHAMEVMVRRMSGDRDLALDKVKDYPHIIGNSTTKHTEYLIGKYRGSFDFAQLKTAFLDAANWNITHARDDGRRIEAETTKKLFLANKTSKLTDIDDLLLVKVGIEIYYQRYHFILRSIAEGEGDDLSAELAGGRHLIEPMDGIALFLVLVKGWLGDELDFISERYGLKPADMIRLRAAAAKFANNGAKVGLVTSSIAYEASVVLSEVFRLVRKEVAAWPISDTRKQRILSDLESYEGYYDTVVTASDSNEMRLKPHRDLYSIALQRLAYKPGDIVLGLEDSEPGILALRAAGIPYAVAVPFEHTLGHNLEAAWKVADGAKAVLLDEFLYLDV